MNTGEHIKFWLESAEHDWDTANSLFAIGKYDWCLFIAHLVLEKTLKALFIQDNNNQLPPKTHNLVKLARNTKSTFTEEQEILLDEVNDFNLEARYPQYRDEFYKKCDKEFCEQYLQKIGRILKWLQSQIKLNQ